ncbi:3-phenylpropionate/cinnamic acid dioxygenase subunit beta [Burkholderia cenocepacia]|uniref:3-phenylpropionate/cinnamic acid dioxygenase subunit beta n=1 Tax=Burkholderia cenocepacia TaxID=95486 RepID=UPI002865E49A|nr:3-phenylpropionate/cinnamic acid dioxygenase subunit beta [Burkholderia cenocepacia]MDR8071884.1 3-phenylpropionate/cinnamic acid dioxygenase subunit beta [Burkholderia cenocepacia]
MTDLVKEVEVVDRQEARVVRDTTYYELKREIEEHLYDEAELLDQRRFKEWLDTLSDDLVYFMPMTYNVKFGEHGQREKTGFEKDMSWFNEGKWTLTKRAEQILTGVHWAEEPLSRLTRLVSNVQITGIRTNDAGQQELSVRSRFLTYQNRCEYEEYYFVGKRNDVFRKEGDGWKLVRREIDLGQTVLLAKNLTVFF